MASRKLRHYF
jgi:hypothetical protein